MAKIRTSMRKTEKVAIDSEIETTTIESEVGVQVIAKTVKGAKASILTIITTKMMDITELKRGAQAQEIDMMIITNLITTNIIIIIIIAIIIAVIIAVTIAITTIESIHKK
jgi:hypothetical protein